VSEPSEALGSMEVAQVARGKNFTYDLADPGRYHRDYVGLMHHFDAVLLPGRA
jgi:hypothetical protein